MNDGERQEAWDAMELIHEALSDLCPAAVSRSDKRFEGTDFTGYAQALVEAVAALSEVAYPKLPEDRLPRDTSLEGAGLSIVPAYTEAGWFEEAHVVTLTDGERTAKYRASAIVADSDSRESDGDTQSVAA